MNELIEKVEQWANDRNLIFGSNAKTQCLKLMSEVRELADNINKDSYCIDDIGNCFVVLIIIAKQLGMTPKQCLQHSYYNIKDRNGVMVNGVFIKEPEYRIKPKTVKFRNYLTAQNLPGIIFDNHPKNIKPLNFKKWLGDWQEVEVENGHQNWLNV